MDWLVPADLLHSSLSVTYRSRWSDGRRYFMSPHLSLTEIKRPYVSCVARRVRPSAYSYGGQIKSLTRNTRRKNKLMNNLNTKTPSMDRNDYFRCPHCFELFPDEDCELTENGYICPNRCEPSFNQPPYQSPLNEND